MKLNASCGVGAIFKCVVRKNDTHEIVKESGEFKNLVLDTGLARMGVGAWASHCIVGSGNSTPTAGQTSLDSLIATTTTTINDSSASSGIQVETEPEYWFCRRLWRFAVGVATGNLSEVALGWGASSLWNRALIKDRFGNPTTITVLSDEYLDVLCEIRFYPKNSTGSFNVIDKLGAIVSTHTYETKCLIRAEAAAWNSNIVDLGTTKENGFSISSTETMNNNSSISSLVDFIIGEKTRSATSITGVVTIPATGANFHHKSFQTSFSLGCDINNNSHSYNMGYKWQINPPIEKTNSMILKYSFTLNWGRYEPT